MIFDSFYRSWKKVRYASRNIRFCWRSKKRIQDVSCNIPFFWWSLERICTPSLQYSVPFGDRRRESKALATEDSIDLRLRAPRTFFMFWINLVWVTVLRKSHILSKSTWVSHITFPIDFPYYQRGFGGKWAKLVYRRGRIGSPYAQEPRLTDDAPC